MIKLSKEIRRNAADSHSFGGIPCGLLPNFLAGVSCPGGRDGASPAGEHEIESCGFILGLQFQGMCTQVDRSRNNLKTRRRCSLPHQTIAAENGYRKQASCSEAGCKELSIYWFVSAVAFDSACKESQLYRISATDVDRGL